MTKHPIIHVDIPANDTSAAARFYNEVFGWQPTHNEEFDSWWFQAEGGPSGAFVTPHTEPVGADFRLGQVRIYLATDDIAASLDAVEAHGGTILGPVLDMGELGGYACFADPAGNIIGLYAAPPQER